MNFNYKKLFYTPTMEVVSMKTLQTIKGVTKVECNETTELFLPEELKPMSKEDSEMYCWEHNLD